MATGPHPGIADAMCGIGISYVKRGRLLDALEAYESLRRLDGEKASGLQLMIARFSPQEYG